MANLEERLELLNKTRNNPKLQAIEIELCKQDILYWFNNYAYTDKNKSLFTQDEPTELPFILFPFQEEMVTEIRNSIMDGTKPLKDRVELTNVFIEKSRQMGASWVIIGIFTYWMLFHWLKFHCISQKETDVDKPGDIRSLFEKSRFMLKNLPFWMLSDKFSVETGTEFNKYMTISNPDNTWAITWESANPNASRSWTYDAILMDEMAFMQNAATINSAAASATPCRIFNSTPYGKGTEFYRMRSLTHWTVDEFWNDVEPEVKWLRYHRSEHPLYDQERYDWKIKGMTKEKIAQELEIDYDTAIIGRVYDQFPAEAVNVEYDWNKPLYVAMDNSHWWQDPNAIFLAQMNWPYLNIIDSVELECTPEEAAGFLTEHPTFALNYEQEKFLERYKLYNWKKAIFISDPYDTKVAMGNSTILNDYKKVWINLMIPKERSKVEQIMKTRANIYRIRYNDHCLDFASAILNARYPERKETSNSTKMQLLPVHNWTSHYRTALEYFITYILENPVAQKAKKKIKDNRPRRNMVTWELMYK